MPSAGYDGWQGVPARLVALKNQVTAGNWWRAASGVAMTLFVGAEHDDPTASGAEFDVRTAQCDATRASIRVSGNVHNEAAAVLAEVIDGHVRAGRRFLRLHVGGVRALSSAAIEIIADAHQRLLARRGTMILTGVTGPLEAELRAATPASPLFLLAPTAADLGN